MQLENKIKFGEDHNIHGILVGKDRQNEIDNDSYTHDSEKSHQESGRGWP
jgi:hypothetical protein